MRKFNDFRIVSFEDKDQPEWQVVHGFLEMDNPEEFFEFDNLFYSGRSRMARMGIESGIIPKDGKLWESTRNRFNAYDLFFREEGVRARIAVRNMNKANYESETYSLSLLDKLNSVSQDWLPGIEIPSPEFEVIHPYNNFGRELELSVGDRIGRIVGFNDEDVAIDTSRQQQFYQMKQLHSVMNHEGGTDSALRFYTENGDHPDLDEVVEGTPYEHDDVARIYLPVDKYAVTTVDGKITMKELEDMNKGPSNENSILEEAGEPPEKVTPGVHYAITEDFQNPGCDLILEDPNELARHTTARIIDEDFEGNQVAYEWLYQGSEPEHLKQLPTRVPAYAVWP